MKKFKFKFLAVLEMKKNKEKEMLRFLGRAQGNYQDSLKNKTKLLEQLQASLLRRESLGRKFLPTDGLIGISVSHFQLEQNHLLGIKQRLIKADQAILRANREMQKALRFYLEARRECRVLEKIYDHDYAEYRKIVQKHEQKQSDELSVMRARLREDLL